MNRLMATARTEICFIIKRSFRGQATRLTLHPGIVLSCRRVRSWDFPPTSTKSASGLPKLYGLCAPAGGQALTQTGVSRKACKDKTGPQTILNLISRALNHLKYKTEFLAAADK